ARSSTPLLCWSSGGGSSLSDKTGEGTGDDLTRGVTRLQSVVAQAPCIGGARSESGLPLHQFKPRRGVIKVVSEMEGVPAIVRFRYLTCRPGPYRQSQS